MAESDLGTCRPAAWPNTAPIRARLDDDRTIVVDYADDTRRLHATWARDCCSCRECRIEQTTEYRYLLGRVDQPPEALTAGLCGADVVIEWSDGHHSLYSPALLQEMVGQSRRRPLDRSTWTSADQLPLFGCDQVLSEPGAQLEFCDAFERLGAVRVSGMGSNGGESARFVEALGAPLRELPFDRIHDVHVDPAGYNVAHTAERVPPHNDFPSYAWPPSGQALHMLTNEATGGDSIVVDGFHLLAELDAVDPATVDVLARVPVTFRQFAPDVETWARQPLVRRDWAGRVVGLRFSNQLMQPLHPEDPELDAFYDAYHRLARAACDPANQATFRLNDGEMVIVHGHRVLHARTAFDATGARHLQDVYFEADDIFARGAMLRGDRPEGPVFP
ncbi:MAG: TauD/TfdA family dioxygenase [Acidimicrobiales bacterium]